MFALLNKYRKILFYFCQIININAYLFQELSVGLPIRREHVSMETESASTDSQINPKTTVVQDKQPTSTNENEAFQFVPVDKSLPIKKRKNYLTNEHNSFLLPSNTQEPHNFIIDKEHRSVDNNSGEESYEEIDVIINDSRENSSEETDVIIIDSRENSSEEIDVITIHPCDVSIHSNLVDLDAENNQIFKPILQDQKLQKYFHKSAFKPYKSDKVDVTCSKLQNTHIHQNDFNTTQFNNVPSTSRVNLIDSIPFDSSKTNATQVSIHENEVIPHSLQNQWKLPTDTITQQYLSKPVPERRTVICNNNPPEDMIYFPVGRRNILDTATLVINTNKDIGNFDRAYSEKNYEAIDLRHSKNEPWRKIPKQILTDVEDNSSSIPSTLYTLGNNHNHIMDTRNQLGCGHTFFLKHISTEDPIRWSITDKNTLLQTSSNTDSNLKISIKDYKNANNDEPSLKKISDDSYIFNFILNGTLLSKNFDSQNKHTLIYDLSGVLIKEINFNSPEYRDIYMKNLQGRYYLYYIPIFHTIDFLCSNNIDYFNISVSSHKYSINLRLEIYISHSKSKEDLELCLKCPRINNFKQLIDKLFETTFPIYPFLPKGKNNFIQFQYLSSLDEPIEEITISDYIIYVKENPLNIDIEDINKYKIHTKRQNGDTKTQYKNLIIWKSGLKIVYEIFKTFYTKISQITIIINDDSKPLDYKMTEINELLNQIIQKIEINCRIKYPQEINERHIIESKLMSFYAFCTNELQNLFKWWNKYLFVNEEVRCIETSL